MSVNQVKKAIAMGFFDGVHIGHAALLEKAKQRAKEIQAEPSVLSFDTHPDKLVFHKEVPLLTDAKGREEIIRRCFGIQNIVFLRFDRETMNMPWQEFADHMIQAQNAAWFVVGHDFTFGRKGEGTAEKLKEYCREKGIGCDIIQPVYRKGRIVSSTYIRSLIENGDMEEAACFLGRPHSLSDVVHSGEHIGQKMDAPTINMFFGAEVEIPKRGVYITKVVLPGEEEHIAVTNIGVRPTVSENGQISVESHIIDYVGDLYGVSVRVDFYCYIREEKKFDSIEELAQQISEDIKIAKAYFARKDAD